MLQVGPVVHPRSVGRRDRSPRKMGACSANGSTEGAVEETVAALGQTGTVLHPVNGTMKMFLEGGWTSLVVVCFYVPQ